MIILVKKKDVSMGVIFDADFIDFNLNPGKLTGTYTATFHE